MPEPPPSIPVKVNPAPSQANDYISRSLLSSLLTKGACTLVGIFARESADSAIPQRVLTLSGVAKQPKNAALDALDRVVEGVIEGKDLSPHFSEIARLIHAQDRRAEIISQLVLTHDYARIARALRAREQLEESLFAAALNDDLLPAEKVLLLEKLESIVTTSRKAIGAETVSINDIQTMLEKLDYTAEMANAGMGNKLKGTTPQGREIVRKLLVQVSRKVREVSDG